MTKEEWEKIQSAPGGILNNVEHYHPEFVRDESRLTGEMESISFPRTEADMGCHLAQMKKEQRPVTVQAMRTGISGGAVPEGGHVLNVNRMTNILGLRRDQDTDTFFLRLQPGVLLREQIWPMTTLKEFDTTGWSSTSLNALEEFKKRGPYLFPPDPSEPTVAIGGMVGNNASGARSFFYGPTRSWIQGLHVMLGDGSVVDLKRGVQKASGRSFSVQTDTGRTIRGTLPTYRMPAVKNSAGYFVHDDMDLIDLFIGSEGTLGVFSEVEVRLIPLPAAMTGVMMFLATEQSAIHFAEDVRTLGTRPVAIEFFDCHSVELLRKNAGVFAQYQMGHVLPAGLHTAVYVEYHGVDRSFVDNAVREMIKTLTRYGGNGDSRWTAHGQDEIRNFKQIKHLLPEFVNGLVAERQEKDPRIRKLGTDLAVPDDKLKEIMALYHRDLDSSGFDYLIFGHLGDNNLHVNIIPKSIEEFERGQQLYLNWARAAVEMGGTVSAEHGIGKLKKALLREMYSEAEIGQMREVKRCFDPDFMLNPGNIFDAG